MIIKAFQNLYKKETLPKKTKKVIIPIFDTLTIIKDTNPEDLEHPYVEQEDLKKSLRFLKSYKGSQGTFNAYRRELERLLQWCGLISNKPLKELKREDIQEFIQFCQKPPNSWIGTKKVSRFIVQQEERIPNPEWKPFVVSISKSSYRKGNRPKYKDFEFSQVSIKETFAILGSFYNYLIQEDYVFMNPVALIRQKSQFIRKQQGPTRIRRLSDLQWKYVINTAKEMAEVKPDKHQRTLFILNALYSMYLRISELAANDRWCPQMKHFHRDNDRNWWFTTVGKGNKQRQIAVSDSMLEALKLWRKHLNLPPTPSPADNTPLLPKTKGKGPIKDTTYIRRIVQQCFDKAIENLEKDKLYEEATSLTEATVHWLRHTGISEDVKHRPKEHVRDDAGHSSSAITDKYIDIELKERHRSAKNKIIPD